MSSITTARHPAWQSDLLIRAAGILLLGLALLTVLALIRMAGDRPTHAATVSEFLLAAGSFAGASGGMMALTTGRGLFEPMPLPRRQGLHHSAADLPGIDNAYPGSAGVEGALPSAQLYCWSTAQVSPEEMRYEAEQVGPVSPDEAAVTGSAGRLMTSR